MVNAVSASQAIIEFEKRFNNAEAGALFYWAVSCVDSLQYLVDLDIAYDGSRSTPGEHSHDIVDVSHARWATSSCITALDLCAAVLGRVFCNTTGPHELDLGSFDSKHKKQYQKNLPSIAIQWIDCVINDKLFSEIKIARDALIHRRLLRHFEMKAGSPEPANRLRLQALSDKIAVPELIKRSLEVADNHVNAFVAASQQF